MVRVFGEIKVRAARQDDVVAIADLYAMAYFTRFFDPRARSIKGELYGAPLAVEHPCLAKGQDRAYFQGYMAHFAENMNTGAENENLCFVAESGDKLLGFVKGSRPPAAAENFVWMEEPPRETFGELGSIYIDPGLKLGGVGTALVKAYAQTLCQAGYERMLTSAYYRNDSPEFFARLGGEVIGMCPIPNAYLNYDKPGAPLEVETIKGVLIAWDAPSFAALCGQAPAPQAARVPSGRAAAFDASTLG